MPRISACSSCATHRISSPKAIRVSRSRRFIRPFCAASSARHPDIAVGLIGIVRKILTYEQAARTTAFIIENRKTFVGLDFADRDIGYEMRRFARLLEKTRGADLHLTLHCAENDVPEAPDQVRMAIEELGAERIGHGIFAARDPAVLAFARKRNVLFELCPTSNWLTSSVATISEHPIRKFMQAGVPVSINSDDPGLFGIDLTHEYEVLQRDLGFTAADFTACNAHGASHSFIPEIEKRRACGATQGSFAQGSEYFPGAPKERT